MDCHSCEAALGDDDPHAQIEVTPAGGLDQLIEQHEFELCPACLKQHQQVDGTVKPIQPAAVDSEHQAAADGGRVDD